MHSKGSYTAALVAQADFCFPVAQKSDGRTLAALT
jgi:hypothetical protein